MQKLNINQFLHKHLERDFIFQNVKVSAAKSIFHLVFIHIEEHHKETLNFSDVILAHICYNGY